MMIIVGYPTYDGPKNDKYNHIHCGENKEVHVVYNPVRAIPKPMHFHHCSEFVLLLVYKIRQHNLNYSLSVSILPLCITSKYMSPAKKKRTPIKSYRKKQDNNPFEEEWTDSSRKLKCQTSGLLRHFFCEVEQHLYT
jgi:hypothetical protein